MESNRRYSNSSIIHSYVVRCALVSLDRVHYYFIYIFRNFSVCTPFFVSDPMPSLSEKRYENDKRNCSAHNDGYALITQGVKSTLNGMLCVKHSGPVSDVMIYEVRCLNLSILVLHFDITKLVRTILVVCCLALFPINEFNLLERTPILFNERLWFSGDWLVNNEIKFHATNERQNLSDAMPTVD